MYLRGIVTSFETKGVRVTFPDKDNNVSSPLKTASHVGELEINNNVVVIFFFNNMIDGLIIAKY